MVELLALVAIASFLAFGGAVGFILLYWAIQSTNDENAANYTPDLGGLRRFFRRCPHRAGYIPSPEGYRCADCRMLRARMKSARGGQIVRRRD